MFVVDEDDDDEKFLHNRNFLHSQTTINSTKQSVELCMGDTGRHTERDRNAE